MVPWLLQLFIASLNNNCIYNINKLSDLTSYEGLKPKKNPIISQSNEITDIGINNKSGSKFVVKLFTL